MDPCKELARLRKEKGLTIKALAELAGTNPGYIGAIEHGKLPSIEVASKLACVLDVPLDVFWPKYKQKEIIDMESVRDREQICRRFAESPGIEILNLSTRSLNALKGDNIETVGELLLLSEEELSKVRRLGPVSQREVKDKLDQYQSGVIDEVAGKQTKVIDVFRPKYKRKRSIDMETLEDRAGIWHQFAESPGLEVLNLSPRTFNALYRANIETVGELLLLSEKELSKIKQFGPASQREVKAKMDQYSSPGADTIR